MSYLGFYSLFSSISFISSFWGMGGSWISYLGFYSLFSSIYFISSFLGKYGDDNEYRIILKVEKYYDISQTQTKKHRIMSPEPSGSKLTTSLVNNM